MGYGDPITYTLQLLFPSAQALVINVPADYPTIQEGINAASNGDTVLVASGTYYEQIDFSGREIVLISESGAESTIIDGQGIGAPMVNIDSGEGVGTVLEGFTVTG